MTQVFLNYRTTDEPVAVAMLDQVLSERFGEAAVFLASKSIPLGVDWEREMFAAIEKSTALLVLVGRNWLDARDDEGRRRLDDPGDFVRREIVAALSLGKQVIPVLLGVERKTLRNAQLPADLGELTRRQSIKIEIHSAQPDIDQLVSKLRHQIPELREAKQAASEVSNSVRAGKITGTIVQAGTMHIGGDFNA